MGRSVVFKAFYADFCLCPKLVIITTLTRLAPLTKTAERTNSEDPESAHHGPPHQDLHCLSSSL